MHLLVRETHALDESALAVDLGQSPAELVLLSFSDSDLGAAAMAATSRTARLPSLRLANLQHLTHPMSVDLYLERVAAKARCVIGRLLGGLDYWRYGAEELSALSRQHGIALALLPGEGGDDLRLGPLSSVNEAMRQRLYALFAAGGPANLSRALDLAAHLAGLGEDPGGGAEPLPCAGDYSFGNPDFDAADLPDRPRAALVFYRSHLLAGDLAPHEALARRLAARGIRTLGLYAASLKDPAAAAFIAERLEALRPSLVLNATGFAARNESAGGSPLDAAGVPVLQLVLAGSDRAAWQASPRGLSPADLAMQVALPELDGRLLAGAISFKAETLTAPALEYSRRAHAPDEAGISAAAERAEGWIRLGAKSPGERRIALVLSDYPGDGGQRAQAVGLDTLASTEEILGRLAQAGYDIGPIPPDARTLARHLCHDEPEPFLSLAAYRRLLARLPAATQANLLAAWGEPEADPDSHDGTFHLRHLICGNISLALQPDRGRTSARKASYHDPDLPPRHAYVAFYLWLRHGVEIDAMIHLGTHGTLEWLPGKAVALSDTCYPALLAGGVPVIYPFIVNNPGEAAVAKRRLGAVTIGHLTPPLARASLSGEAVEIEKRIDEYAAADGLDRRRAALLRTEILSRAAACGLLAESGVKPDAADEDALARLDAYLCDVKELQIRDGLHVFGHSPRNERRDRLLGALACSCPDAAPDDLAARLDDCGRAEVMALIAALDARFVAPGPAGAPTRGRADVLPTGRNLYALDPRAVPTRTAVALAEKAATELLRRHLQDHGDWPRALVIDLWGSATLRTGGEALALALLLIGAKPQWDTGSDRVIGFEVLPLALLDRPRIDVTLRVSGLFRDAFAAQIALFDAAVQAIARRDEPDEAWNPLAARARGLEGPAFRRATTRIFGALPGRYGAAVTETLVAGDWREPGELGLDYLRASAGAYGQGLDGASDADGFQERVRQADAYLHAQDHREIDLLDSPDFAAHAGGFAALATSLGRTPALYHADTADPTAPKVRALAEEVARVVRGRAANPAWIRAMMQHGYQGGGEITRAALSLFGFAATLPTRFDRQFDLLFDATLGDAAVDRFLRAANPAAHAALVKRLEEALRRGLWHPHRNQAAEILGQDGFAPANVSCSNPVFDRVIETSGDVTSGHHAPASEEA